MYCVGLPQIIHFIHIHAYIIAFNFNIFQYKLNQFFYLDPVGKVENKTRA